MDRIDLQVEVPALPCREIASAPARARTIADLAGEPRIGLTHVAEAIQYRERPHAAA